MMHQYELLYVLPGTLGEAEVAPRIRAVAAIVEQVGGKDVDIREQGKNRLAYPIKHIRYGYFALGRFKMDSEAVPVLEQKLRLTENALRLLVQRVEEGSADAIAFAGMSAAPRDREEDEDAPREHAPQRETAREAAPAPAPAPVKEKSASSKAKAAPAAETKVEDVNVGDITKKLDALLEDDIASV